MLDRIDISPDVHFGKPCVRNTRIPVYCVLELIGQGVAMSDVPRDYYPDLTVEDVQACLDYATALLRGDETHSSLEGAHAPAH